MLANEGQPSGNEYRKSLSIISYTLRTIEESVQNNEGSRSSFSSFLTVMSSLTAKTAAMSSNLGTETSSCRARSDFDIMNEQKMLFSLSTDRKKHTTP